MQKLAKTGAVKTVTTSPVLSVARYNLRPRPTSVVLRTGTLYYNLRPRAVKL